MVVPDDEADRLRGVLTAFLVPGQTRIHWRKSSPAGRVRLVQLICTLEPSVPAKLVIERSDSQGEADDRRAVLDGRHQGAIPGRVSYGHADPETEPLLWLADIAAGLTHTGTTTWPGLTVISI